MTTTTDRRTDQTCADCGARLGPMDNSILQRDGGIHGRKYFLCTACSRRRVTGGGD